MYTYTVGKRSQIDSLFINGWSRQFAGDAEGVDYGIGVYCNISYDDTKTPKESIGRFNRNPHQNCIFRNVLKGGLDRFLIFDEGFANKVYGENHSIKDQVYTILPKDAADDLWRDMVRYIRMDTSPQGNGNHMRGRTAGLLQFMMSKRLKGNVANPKKYESLFGKYNIRGAIYRGNLDGFCMVVYNYDEIIPVAYSVDGGRTYIKKDVKFTYPDVVRKLRHFYADVEYPVALESDGQIYYFAKVRKKNGKYNYIDASTREEISPFDFDSCTTMSPPYGTFQVEYNGNFYDACPDGFYDNNGEGHEWSELGNFEEDDINNLDEKMSKPIGTLFTQIINEVNSEMGVDEFIYDGIEINDKSYFDSPDIPSIYHVTRKQDVPSIFKFGEDREFLKTYAYGKGVYTAYDVHDAKNQWGSYGDAMIQFKLIGGYKNFIIFPDSEKCRQIARKYYGENYDIYDQLRTFLSPKDASYVYGKCGRNIEAYSHFAKKFHIHGAVYQWGATVAVLPYDFSSVVPYAVSYDCGRTFEKKLNDETFNRFQTSVDVEFRFGNKYARVDKAVAFPNEKGEMTGYAKVVKKNGKYNIIDIQTGEEMIPDVDSCSTMNTDKNDDRYGCFQVEYDGEWYDACLAGFWDHNGEERGWEELGNFEEDDINDLD